MDYLNKIHRDNLEDIIRECNIRNKIPRYTKMKKQELVEKMIEFIDVVEKDGEYHAIQKEKDSFV